MARSGPTHFLEVCRAPVSRGMTPHVIAFERLRNLNNTGRRVSQVNFCSFRSSKDVQIRFIHLSSPVQPHSRLESKLSLQGMQREAPLAYRISTCSQLSSIYFTESIAPYRIVSQCIISIHLQVFILFTQWPTTASQSQPISNEIVDVRESNPFLPSHDLSYFLIANYPKFIFCHTCVQCTAVTYLTTPLHSLRSYALPCPFLFTVVVILQPQQDRYHDPRHDILCPALLANQSNLFIGRCDLIVTSLSFNHTSPTSLSLVSPWSHERDEKKNRI